MQDVLIIGNRQSLHIRRINRKAKGLTNDRGNRVMRIGKVQSITIGMRIARFR
jgi:hypothetical protein